MRLVLCRAFLALFLLVTPSAWAREFSAAQQERLEAFAAHNSLFVLYHETAHMLFHQLDLPVLGREEDAADNVATWTILSLGLPDAEQILTDAAQGWMLSGVAYDSGGTESDFAARYSLDKQRAYQIVCLMVGSDARSFAPLANRYLLEGERQSSCALDFEMIDKGMRKLVGAFGERKIKQESQVNVTYLPVSGKLNAAAQAFRRSGVFDQVAETMRRNYRLPRPIEFVAMRCSEANAYYDPSVLQVQFCYELMQDYMDLYAAELPPYVPGKKKKR